MKTILQVNMPTPITMLWCHTEADTTPLYGKGSESYGQFL